MDIADISAWVIPVVLAITLHEAAHGWVAEKFGDDTARRMGRITFNPLKHIDRFGTIIFPALLLLIKSPIIFGYAKPVPVNFDQLTPPRFGMFMVAIAGVTVNFLLAFASALLLHIDQWVSPEQAPWVFKNLYRSITINCALIVLNMIPLLPLDGGRVVDAWLTGSVRRWYRAVERYGIFIVLALLLLFDQIVSVPAYWLVERILWLSGNTQ